MCCMTSTEQMRTIGIRVPEDTVARLRGVADLARRTAPAGVEVSLSWAARRALEIGLDALERGES